MNHSDILYGGEPTSTEVSHESTGSIADRMYPSKEPSQGNTIISSGQYTPPEIQQRTASQNPATALYGDDEPYTPPTVDEVDENPLERKDRQGKSLYPDDKPIEFDIPEHIKELRNSPERLISGDNLGNTVNAELFNEAVQDPALAKITASIMELSGLPISFGELKGKMQAPAQQQIQAPQPADLSAVAPMQPQPTM